MDLKHSPFHLMVVPTDTRLIADSLPDSVKFEKIVCPLKPGHQRAGRRLTQLDVSIPRRIQGDDLIFTWLSYCLIRAPAYEVLQEAQLSGLNAFPAKARFADTYQQVDVFELVITGFAGVLPGAQLTEYCPGCGHLRYRLPGDPTEMPDLSRWDGSDFCFAWPLPRLVLVSQRAVAVMRSAGLSGARFVREFPPFTEGELVSPGHLSDYLPLERASALSSEFGIPEAPVMEEPADSAEGR